MGAGVAHLYDFVHEVLEGKASSDFRIIESELSVRLYNNLHMA